MSLGFPGGAVVKNLPAYAGDSGLIPGVGKSPWSRTTPVLLPGEPHRQATVHEVAKTDITEHTQKEYVHLF